MAFTQADADALERAIAKGARRLKIGGEEVEYRSLGEMRQVLAMIKAEVAGAAGGFVVGYPTTGRGL